MVLHTRGRVGSRRFNKEAFEIFLEGFFVLYTVPALPRVSGRAKSCDSCQLFTSLVRVMESVSPRVRMHSKRPMKSVSSLERTMKLIVVTP